MKHVYTLSLVFILISLFNFSYAQMGYGRVLFRVNAGGWNTPTIDTSAVNWTGDDTHQPCPWIDTLAMGNKTFGVVDFIPKNSTVAPTTPNVIFMTERDLGNLALDTLQYNFPIPDGQVVEVRLFFSENYFNNVGDRLMDIIIEDNVVQKDFDVFAEAGGKTGMMKKFRDTSDGNIDIDLKQVNQYPMINGIEIIEWVEGGSIQGVLSSNSKVISIGAFPNPFANSVTLDFGNNEPEELRLFNNYGEEVPFDFDLNQAMVNIELEQYPKGIYFLRARMKDSKNGTVKLIKD